MLETRRRTSILGVLAILTGIAAAVLTRVHVAALRPIQVGPIHADAPLAIGLAGLLLGFVSFVAAGSSRRTRTGAPLLAMVICAAAIGFILYSSGWNPLPPAATKVQATPVPQLAAPSNPATRPGPPQPPRDRTIFDPDFPSSAPPPDTTAQPAPASQSPGSAIQPPAASDRQAAVRAARARLDAARAAVVHSLESTDTYRTASAEADAAEADLKKARADYTAGSPELIAVSQRAMDARGKVQKLIANAMARDPAASAAQRELQSIQPSVKR